MTELNVKFFVFSLAFLVGLWLAQACSAQPKPPTNATVSASEEPNLPIKVTVSADKTSYFTGESIQVSIYLQNVSVHTLQVLFPPLVRLEKVNGPISDILVQEASFYLLRSKEQLSLTVHLPEDAPSIELQPGSYVVLAETRTDQIGTGKEERFEGKSSPFMVKTN